MSITQAVLDAARERAPFDVEQLREEMKSKTPMEANSAERVKDYLATGAEQARVEGVGLERILGGNDLQQINYLERGLAASRSVGRVNIVDPASGNLEGFGTGFLIAPNLLLTNNHVLPSKDVAAASFVEFNYQLDINGAKTNQDAFELDADACYITSVPLDFTVVGVKSKSDRNVDLSKYGFLKLDPTPGKTLDANYLTVIQHPSGQRKQIAIRENQLIKTQTNTLWYATDTAPGSSGSCVFNDAWQVVALHHSG
ncbi:MAG TPA: serine protease, partial [Thermoanaerobaculia bacterium]|nr:serine protease [Thermoanaerobaculia bacterium]